MKRYKQSLTLIQTYNNQKDHLIPLSQDNNLKKNLKTIVRLQCEAKTLNANLKALELSLNPNQML